MNKIKIINYFLFRFLYKILTKKNLYINIFLKNFNFLKQKKNNNLLFINNFEIYFFYFFYNLFYLFYFFDFFCNNNIINSPKNKFTKFLNLFKSSSSEDEFKKKKFFVKFFLYKKSTNKNIYNNHFSININNFKKSIFLNKFNFSKNTNINICNKFYKTKIQNKTKKNKIFFNFIFISNFFYNFCININSFFLLNLIFKNSKYKKNFFFYKNIFKNFFFIKNINQYFLNKNFFLLNNNLLDNLKINFFLYKNINFIFNNQYPLIFFKKFNNYIFNKFNLKKKNNFLNLFNSYFLNFFEFFFKKNFFIKISNKIQVNQYKKIILFLQNYNNNIKFQKFFDSNEMIELICIVFLYKDLTLLKNWVIFILNNINIKNHKKFFIIFNDFIVDNFSLFSNIFNIKGFYFCVKGKIGLSGNAKKKKFFFKKGLLKVSSKNFKIDNQRFFIKTNCGSLGVNMILSY